MVSFQLRDLIINRFRKIYYWLQPILKEYGITLIILLSEFVLIRVYEFFYLKSLYQFSFGKIRFELLGIYYDFLFIALLSIVFFIPYSALFKISRRTTRVLFYILNSLCLLIVLILIDYLKNTFTPLDHAIFAYPLNDLLYIVKESVNIIWLDYVRYIVIILFGTLISIFFIKRLKSKILPIISIVFLLSGILLTKNLNPARRNFSNDTAFNLTINKLSFFTKSCANYLKGTPAITTIEFNQIADRYQKIHRGIQYHNLTYPLEHSPDTTDYLSTYFNLNEEPPNLVFIIMESLSSAFCGDNAYIGNFTPFLDSLINKSLYWKNFLSTSERTFNAIPSIFGSLPYGEKGFMNLVQNDFAVNHTTLIKWLNENKYQTNFFYGGWTGFDNMEKFMKYQNIDFILEKFGDQYSKIEKDKDGVTWGYPDNQVYQRSFEILDSINETPRLDIYLTLSLHHPFKPPNKDYYHQKLISYLASSNLNEEQRKEAEIHSEVFETILYTDEAVKYFFSEYKKREEYKNTIFIITGDHRMSTQNRRSNIDIYHVPLIIFSPMLKTPVKFSSVSSHLNITPTFYAFLAKNYGFKMPIKVSWLGNQIDFSRKFQNTHIIPLMRTNREITDYISGKYFLSNGELFKIEDKLDLELIKDNNLLDSLQQDLTNFVILNKYITENNLLISDE